MVGKTILCCIPKKKKNSFETLKKSQYLAKKKVLRKTK